LSEEGFIDGHNVSIESRFAESKQDRLPTLAIELIARQVNVVVATGGTSSAVAAKPVVPTTIPMVFAMGGDPVKLGIVDGLARPGGHITGVAFVVNAAKHLQLLQELVPKAKLIGFLVNPNDPNLMSDLKYAQDAARLLGHRLISVNASIANELEPAFARLASEKVEALFVQVGSFTTDQRTKIAALAAQHSLPTIYALREFVDAGGLMCYGTSISAWRLRWPSSQWHKTGRSSGDAVDGVRAGDQSPRVEVPRPDDPAIDSAARQ